MFSLVSVVSPSCLFFPSSSFFHFLLFPYPLFLPPAYSILTRSPSILLLLHHSLLNAVLHLMFIISLTYSDFFLLPFSPVFQSLPFFPSFLSSSHPSLSLFFFLNLLFSPFSYSSPFCHSFLQPCVLLPPSLHCPPLSTFPLSYIVQHLSLHLFTLFSPIIYFFTTYSSFLVLFTLFPASSHPLLPTVMTLWHLFVPCIHLRNADLLISTSRQWSRRLSGSLFVDSTNLPTL